MFSSIRTKLTVWYIAILSVFILAFAGITYLVLMRSLDRDLDDSLTEMARSFTAAASAEAEDAHDQQINEGSVGEAASEMRFRDYQFLVYRPDGGLLASTAEFELPWTVVGSGPEFRDVSTGGRSQRSYRTDLPVGLNTYHLVVVHSLDDLAAMRRKLLTVFAAGVPLTLLFAGLGGYYLARKSLAPVVQMSRQADLISANNLDKRLDVQNEQDELGQLGTVLNRLLTRLDQSFEQQRRFMADASHELRTPLAIVRGESEVALSTPRSAEDYRESLAVVENESRRLSKIVDDLFTLARADAGRLGLNVEPVYLDEIVTEAARSIGILARKKNIAIDFKADSELPMWADEALLRRLFLNLLDNAVKYTAENGRISIDWHSDDQSYLVTIADTGRGIPALNQPLIFERFYRVDPARSREAASENSGSGLGLAIAQWVAELHRGKIELVSSSNQGSVFSVRLPR